MFMGGELGWGNNKLSMLDVANTGRGPNREWGWICFKQHQIQKKLVSVVTFLTKPKVHIKFRSKSKANMHWHKYLVDIYSLISLNSLPSKGQSLCIFHIRIWSKHKQGPAWRSPHSIQFLVFRNRQFMAYGKFFDDMVLPVGWISLLAN
jgi:hypothetical protein